MGHFFYSFYCEKYTNKLKPGMPVDVTFGS